MGAQLGFGLAAGFLQGLFGLISAKKQNDLAESLVESAQYYRDQGIQMMTKSINQRKEAYDSIWKLVYGGVRGADTASLVNQDWIGDRYYYDEEGKLKRKDSVGPNSERGEYWHEEMEKQREAKAAAEGRGVYTSGKAGGGPTGRGRGGYTSDHTNQDNSPSGYSRETSATGSTANKSGVSISKKSRRVRR